MKKSILTLSIALALTACSSIPDYERPAAPVPGAWPQGQAYAPADTAETKLPEWHSFFRDPALQRVIQVALDNNRDLRVAALNVQAYQAQYRIQRSALAPSVSADGTGSRQRVAGNTSSASPYNTSPYNTTQYNISVGISSWEIDFFGRLRALKAQALEQYFASEEAQRGAQVSLVASVATAWLTRQADSELLALSQRTLESYEKSYALTERSNKVGVATALELQQARSLVESARAQVAQYTRLVAQDLNALQLLLGAGLPADLPAAQPLDRALLDELPVGLPSTLLERRPDILEAEHALKAANASIGAARAAFFPTIGLTANAGLASGEFKHLFDATSARWLGQPQISVPIFTAGRLKGSLDYAKVQKQVQVAQYEKAIQTAFREVSDGLAARGTYREQLNAQGELVKASSEYYRLAEKRYRSGVDSSLTFLDAQRQLFTSQQTLIGDRLAQLGAEIGLYKALGGGVE